MHLGNYFERDRPEVLPVTARNFTGVSDRSRRLSRNSAAASALIISTSGFGPTWRLTDGNTDDSPKDRLDLYDGKELRSGFVAGVSAQAAPLSVCLSGAWAAEPGR